MPRLLLPTTTHLAASPPPPPPLEVDSDVVVILAALLCALICVIGLSFITSCAWLRRSVSQSPPAPPNKGLKKNVLHSIPKVPFSGGVSERIVECAICLGEFTDGDVIRILPQCGHGFHVGCVDKWLSSNSSCPSCRRVPVVAPPPSRCSACGASSDVAVEVKDGDVNWFLP